MAATLSRRDRRYLARVSLLVLGDRLTQSGIDPVANVERMLQAASADHRAAVVRLVRWSRRLGWLFGGTRTIVRGRWLPFVSLRRLTHALAALCLTAFYGDERTS